MTEVRFYLDENIDKAVAEQLRRWEIDAISVHDLKLQGDSDPNHLKRSTSMKRVLCTHDQDFPRMARENTEHSGIIYAPHYQANVGGWVRALRTFHANHTLEDVQGLIFFLSAK